MTQIIFFLSELPFYSNELFLTFSYLITWLLAKDPFSSVLLSYMRIAPWTLVIILIFDSTPINTSRRIVTLFYTNLEWFDINNYYNWLYVLIMSHTCFSVYPHSIVAWMSRNSLLETDANLNFKWLQLDSNPQPLSS